MGARQNPVGLGRKRQLQRQSVAAGAAGVAGDAAEVRDQRQAGAAAAVGIGHVEHRGPRVEGMAGVADRHADDPVAKAKAQDDAGAVLRAAMLDHVGDPLLHDHGQATGHHGVEAGAERKAADQFQGARNGGRIGRQPRAGLDARLGVGAELSYVVTPAETTDSEMRGTIIAGLLIIACLSTGSAAAAAEIGRIKSVTEPP